MLRRNTMIGFGGGLLLAGLAWITGLIPVLAQDGPKLEPAAPTRTPPAIAPAPPQEAPRLVAQLAGGVVQEGRPEGQRLGAAFDPIVIPGGRLAIIQKQEVPSQHDGQLLVIGTEVKPGEQVPANRLLTVTVGGEERKFRELREGDVVEPNQLLAQIDDRLARNDKAIAQAKVKASEADLLAAQKTKDETYVRWQRGIQLSRQGNAIAQEEVGERKLSYDRYSAEALSKEEAVELAKNELNKAQTTLQMYEVRSAIPGIVKTIYKQRGESVKNLDPVLQIHNIDRLRIEGLVEVQHLPYLHPGMHLVVEPMQYERPKLALVGHRMEITGVAVSKDTKNPAIVSSSEDGTVRVWTRGSRYSRREYTHPAAVKSIACTPTTATANLCLSGAADGTARLFDLDKDADQPIREFKGEHRGAINAVAFSPDGQTCITGGEDRRICLWDVNTGALKYRFPSQQSHRGAITSLKFTPQGRVVSAGRDNALKLWTLNAQDARLERTIEGRGGYVTDLGVSPDGKTAVFDKDEELYLLSLASGATTGILQNPSGSNAFTTLAEFSPDGQLVLAAGSSDGRVQLWRLPTAQTRGYELRQWIAPERSAVTCGAFSPDGSFAVTGNKDRQLFIWPMPSRQEIDHLLTAEVIYIEKSIESSARQVRIWAELANPGGRLIPGSTATLVAYPRKP